ncbi:TTC39/IML2 family protein [Aspergillus saccharolyticus JOP 1030-1]|uniref:Inclusion body clearance protein IML2 n=1 Tax=Aspergillus saccharolyticus JOP 1030-1 TaxID=1450539 RepID=A0A318ZIS1_9EURO|nr:mitochondrial outer membrane protein iml2 [Aspergillus saccharolyticus JOP 1030-1]PYH46244.1 mitochondrial outer membrane protein iml2 [Aspergillus saccharolyticus JOP 1030-1]
MFRVGSWLYGKKPGANASTQSLDSLSELRDLEDALRATTLILNDDVDGAEDGLSEGTSSFHNLGRGVVAFIRATLGFEQEIMRQASERLNVAETSAASDQHRAQHNSHAPNSYHSQIYAPGTEFALCQAMAQLMSAVVGVLNESLTESIKGFYKLRKAYITLDAILKMEQKFIIQERGSGSSTPTEMGSSSTKLPGPSVARTAPASPVDSAGLSEQLSGLTVSGSTETLTTNSDMLNLDPESDIFKNQIDVFVHSGANFCFGLLLVLISMVPPVFSKLLGIIGFHGDKERGLKMLWQASKFHNLIGGLSAFAILGYSNGFVRYCDIMPDPASPDDVQGYPQERLEALLALMRQRFPKSQLWLLEESRMNAANRRLDVALELLCGEERSPLKQVEALRIFERSLNAMYLHRYELCAKSFIECVELNSWSRSLYYYIAGASHLSRYRSLSTTDAAAAAQHADKATEYFRMAPPLAGKKKFMARQLPFDVFVSRKIAKWEARAKEWKVSFIEAVGVDPIEEMIFFWNGHSRMTQAQLEESLTKLAWSEGPANKERWAREGPEEKAILQILRAAVYRAMRRHDEAKELIQTGIFSQDKAQFTGQLRDNWIYPVAHFEMAANLWMERPTYQALHGQAVAAEGTGGEGDAVQLERRQVRECKEHLEKAAKWESYELDARIGLKVTAAMGAVQKWESTHSTSV